jgi:hypothetical protein
MDYLDSLGAFNGFPYYRTLPPENSEYVVSRFKLEYYPTGLPGNLTYQLNNNEFKAFSQSNIEYDEVSPYVMPWKKDVFDNYIYPNDSFELDILSLVNKNDAKPVLYYEKGKLWFRLY